jgi:hypothetical protein
MLILKRDGVEVMRGDDFQVLAWIHCNHSYSLDHAVRHEGYSVEEAGNAGPDGPSKGSDVEA